MGDKSGREDNRPPYGKTLNRFPEEDIKMFTCKQCIVIRQDLKLSKGKLAVQVAHAAVSASEKADSRIYSKWKAEGQKKVVLKVPAERDLYELREIARAQNLPTALIQDAGLTEIKPGTVTALGIGPATNEDIERITGSLKLL
ncbi:MAG: peptidyl-tRNA hydrolase, PTH2 family [Methanohalophilus sp. T328-1]|jgi:PTH2 family peptidyl-tRNA hydrolase|nr:MAG: peptidyl-tRNA hydrolase, PTH2 family [Methanohalophilus sp. T328-1]ODV49121.1 MAG: peptidyl-tRNA hydrolase, PTH2 family [Methanohalophilus sp. 2-GBenrich]RSD34583.1 MAG: peptidyl-tRNA hydrolase, PTH2 family [Methanohalophilus sp.]RSD35663.1 MAG: peptidyl-tRNA hydrolase, PTH2 family [Methanohalophilus sp.]RXG33780.1 peptidyl-tRNA hydrolase, PTH2 family [Methanohalophilus sp. WG1-DM]